MEIKSINLSIGKTSANKNENVNNSANTNTVSSNPFGVSFKGNVIQADVFEKSTDSNLVAKVSEKSKLFASAVVGNINNFNNSLKARMNSVVSFGQKIKSNVFDTFEKISNVGSNMGSSFNGFTTSLRNTLFPNNQYSVGNLVKLPVLDLEAMLSSELSV